MKIITVAHQKGGVGKTTLSFNLAYCFKEGFKVALLDDDLQGSIIGIKKFLNGIDVFSQSEISNLEQIQSDISIIDTPPYLTNRLLDLFSISDFVLIPTKVGLLDVMAIRATIGMIEEAKKNNPNLRAGIVLNMVKHRTSLTDEIKEILKEYSVPLLTSQITDRVSYSRSMITNGVLAGEDMKAKEEMMNLAGEIIDILITV
jgi:chromosome partitioning protein